jgi:hypothetical protein
MDPYAEDVDDCLHASPPTSHIPDPEEEADCGRFDTVLVRKHPKNGLEFGMSSKCTVSNLLAYVNELQRLQIILLRVCA